MASPASEHVDPSDRSRVVAVINGKGGVLKTSIVANVGGRLAAAGYRVLLVDLDISGNLKLDLGLIEHESEDAGRGLLGSIWNDEPLPIVRNIRTNLDFIFGGRNLEMLGLMSRLPSAAQELPSGSVPHEFARKLAEVAGDYDLIFLDCPPGNSELQEMALAATGWVLIPTKTDQASWDGLLAVGPRVKNARAGNPDLRYLGVVITSHNPSATRILRSTREMLGEIGETVPMFDTFIRLSETAAHDCRARGQLAHELARDATQARAGYFGELRERSRRAASGLDVLPLTTQLSGTANSLAEDYRQLAQEICDRIAAAVTDGSETAAGPADGSEPAPWALENQGGGQQPSTPVPSQVFSVSLEPDSSQSGVMR